MVKSSIKSIYHKNDLFSLAIHQGEIDTKIVMELFASEVNTEYIPATYPLLAKYIPTILYSKCFNEKNYPFSKEVEKTEIGHLFEHILLEYLCRFKLAAGLKDPIHNGVTKWDWKKDAKGVFHILIDSGYRDYHIFREALENSIRLTFNILSNHTNRRSLFVDSACLRKGQ